MRSSVRAQPQTAGPTPFGSLNWCEVATGRSARTSVPLFGSQPDVALGITPKPIRSSRCLSTCASVPVNTPNQLFPAASELGYAGRTVFARAVFVSTVPPPGYQLAPRLKLDHQIPGPAK